MSTHSYFFRILASATALLAAGCASERVTADYTMPARAVADVGAVSLLDIVAAAKLSGNRVADGDAARAAALIRQHLSARLYQEGFYQTTDAVWGPDIKGAKAVGETASRNGSRHGYPAFAPMAPDATGRLELTLDLAVDATRVARNEEITLTTIPYVDVQRKEGSVPSSIPNPDPKTHSKRIVPVNYDVWTVSGTGTLLAKLFDVKTGKLVYEKSFDLEAPDDDPRCEPTLLRAVSAAVDPAIRDLVADISPHQESRSLDVNEDAHPRVVAFLAAKDFVDTVLEVDRLAAEKAKADPDDDDVYVPVVADFENKAVALEVLGQYGDAKLAWKKVLALQPDYPPAVAGVERVEKILAGAKAVRLSGAKKQGTEFKRDAVNNQAY